MGETPQCRITFTIKALCLAVLYITAAEGGLTEDLTKDIMAFPGFSDLPLCGSCRVAHITGYCAGKDHIVSLTGCKTASCLCDPSREQTITNFILREAGSACGTKDTATPGAAVSLYRAFCASQPEETSVSRVWNLPWVPILGWSLMISSHLQPPRDERKAQAQAPAPIPVLRRQAQAG
jgi:hypothetical protein